jgi:hypothetical protein
VCADVSIPDGKHDVKDDKLLRCSLSATPLYSSSTTRAAASGGSSADVEFVDASDYTTIATTTASTLTDDLISSLSSCKNNSSALHSSYEPSTTCSSEHDSISNDSSGPAVLRVPRKTFAQPPQKRQHAEVITIRSAHIVLDNPSSDIGSRSSSGTSCGGTYLQTLFEVDDEATADDGTPTVMVLQPVLSHQLASIFSSKPLPLALEGTVAVRKVLRYHIIIILVYYVGLYYIPIFIDEAIVYYHYRISTLYDN